MKLAELANQARIWTVRADVSVTDCVRILRDRAVGALVVLSADKREEIVGIFTERDLVKNFELIRTGGYWDTPVRTVMTSDIHTITADQIAEAPKLMAQHRIRHLPVVAEEKGRKRLIGVISMRDVFQFVMDECKYDLGRVYRLPETTGKMAAKATRGKKKVMAIFSADPAMKDLVDKSAKITRHMLVRAAPLNTEFENLHEVLERFDALFIDLDDLGNVELSRVLAAARAVGKENLLFLVFNPARLGPKVLEELRLISQRRRVHLLSKPVALGLLYEQFLRDV